MSKLSSPFRRAVLAGLAISVTALPAFALSQPAGAAPADQSTTAEATVSSAPGVTAEAWAAGRAKLGKSATATQAVTTYWTPARMKAATPVEDSPTFQAAVQRYERSQNSKSAQDQAAKNENGAPLTVAAQGGLLGKAARSAKSGLKAAAVNPNLPYYAPTARTSGKVFFTMNGLNYQCSGTIVNSEGLDTVWTAGHCVNAGSGGGWAYNWQFVPAYNSTSATPRPYGTWTASQLWTTGGWNSSSDFTADMGVAIMGTNFGYHIVNYLGGQGLRANAGKNVWENAFGYPAEAPFSGGQLFRCYGTSSPEWTVFWVTSDTIKIPCDMTRGSSGGAWLNGWDGNWGYLNGVNSRIDQIVGPTIMLSPYFDDTALTLYNATRYL
jgi:V8-like Glu-specific endopeptidase